MDEKGNTSGAPAAVVAQPTADTVAAAAKAVESGPPPGSWGAAVVVRHNDWKQAKNFILSDQDVGSSQDASRASSGSEGSHIR